jgi:2-C-methyl-D-erythritol 4-phosphate cytidylyltransferase
MKSYAIIVAGGIGNRMQSLLPKQFLDLSGKAILWHSIEIFHSYDPSIEIIVSMHPAYIDYWKKECAKNNYSIEHRIVEGGKTRFHSVQNALTKVTEPGFVAIHDAARPLISQKFVSTLFEEAMTNKNCIPVLPVSESIRKISDDKNIPLQREKYFFVQTPQIFYSGILLKAYQQTYQPSFTDDASVVENMGYSIHTSEGLANNFKVTTLKDILLAELLLSGSTKTDH